jgi:tetratricopeptide (TPR) repeat protein
LVSGCTTGPRAGQQAWPRVDVLPASPPADLNREAAAATLRQGSDGFWYAVGALGPGVESGTPLMGRYSGEWPLRDVPRPAMVFGHVIKRFAADVALVHLDSRMPNVDVGDLEVTWEQWPVVSGPGKGIGLISEVALDGSTVTFTLGKEQGVQRGDLYGLLLPVTPGAAPVSGQLTRRLVGICLVRETSSDGATCRMWQGHPAHGAQAAPRVGDQALFMEASFGRAPRPGRILVSTVEGNERVTQALRESIGEYLAQYAYAEADVAITDVVVNARDVEFHRYFRRIDDEGIPTVFVGASVHDVRGRPHLFVNYTGISSATGPGMIAAPPEGGIDLGPVDRASAQFRSLSGLLMSALMVYRGQTTESLMHLHGYLGDRSVTGPMRWHARDQYAMRWGALGNYEEALWLALEDEAVAASRGDEKARLNAKGTRVRLYDFLDQKSQAYELAREYLEARRPDHPNTGYLSALGMYAEMALGSGDREAAEQALAELEALCPEGCEMDLLSYMAGMYWAVGPDDRDLQDRLVERMVALARAHGGPMEMGVVRMFQGFNFMRDANLEQALIAFLEAQRLYGEAGIAVGETRARYFIFLAQLAREERQEAFEHALAALEQYTELRDFDATVRVYERLMNLYAQVDFSGPPQAYLGAARRVLSAAIQAQIARNDFGRGAEAMFTSGSFMFRINQFDEARAMFQQAVWFGVQSTRFDVVALSHLYLGVMARASGDMEGFRDELNRARLMARIADDPAILELIENTINPPDPQQDVPTQVL